MKGSCACCTTARGELESRTKEIMSKRSASHASVCSADQQPIPTWLYRGAYWPVQEIPYADRKALFEHKLSKDYKKPHPLEQNEREQP